jgi:hypothetical protein
MREAMWGLPGDDGAGLGTRIKDPPGPPKEPLMKLTPPPPPLRRPGATDWMSAISREQKKAIEDMLHIAEESKEESLAQALGKFMKANGDACKSMTP